MARCVASLDADITSTTTVLYETPDQLNLVVVQNARSVMARTT